MECCIHTIQEKKRLDISGNFPESVQPIQFDTNFSRHGCAKCKTLLSNSNMLKLVITKAREQKHHLNLNVGLQFSYQRCPSKR